MYRVLLDAEMASLITMVGGSLYFSPFYLACLSAACLSCFDPEMPKLVCQLSNQSIPPQHLTRFFSYACILNCCVEWLACSWSARLICLSCLAIANRLLCVDSKSENLAYFTIWTRDIKQAHFDWNIVAVSSSITKVSNSFFSVLDSGLRCLRILCTVSIH